MKHSNQPLFSVCIPCYNSEKYISKCIDSILKQNFHDYEIVAINDGSTDKTLDILNDFARTYNNIKVISQQNKGLFHTRITAFDNAIGKYIVSVDADDYVENDFFEVLTEYVYSYDIIIYNYNKYYEYNNKIITADFSSGINADELKHNCLFSNKINAIWRKAIKRELIDTEKLKPINGINMWEDWFHSFFPIINCKTIIYIDKPIYNYRINQSSMTNKMENEEERIKKFHLMYNMLSQYLNSDYLNKQFNIDKFYLENIIKGIVYSPAVPCEYDEFVRKVDALYSDDLLIKSYVGVGERVSLIYRLPYILIRNKSYKLLYAIKRLSYMIRRR